MDRQLFLDFESYDDEKIKERGKETLKKIQEALHVKNKRKNQIEKAQKEHIRNICEQLICEYKDCIPVDVDTSHLGKENENLYLTDDGDETKVPRFVKLQKKKGVKKDKVFGTKTFDGYLSISINGIEYVIFFILKGVENSGGHQDDVLIELGNNLRLIRRLEDDCIYFIFMLDGREIHKYFDQFPDSDNYEVITSEELKDTLKRFIDNKFNNTKN